MERQKRSNRTILLAGCVCSLFAGGAHAALTSGPVACFVNSGQSNAGYNPALDSSYGVQCSKGRDTDAWIVCSGEVFPLQCFGAYKATADGRGIACFDSFGVYSVDSPQYCPRDGGGGGAGGCAVALQGPQETVAMAIGGEPHTVAFPKSSFVLNRMEAGESDVSFLMEEWAVIGPSIRRGEIKPRLKVLKASSPAFAAAKAKDLERSAHIFQKRSDTDDTESGEILLVVEAPVHPHNSRFTPTPSLELSDTEVPPGMSPASVLIRADFSENEDSPRQLQVLNARGPVSQELMDLLKDRLKLDRRSMKRHRTIVFAIVRIGDTVELTSLTTVMPKCCCGGVRCV